MCCGGGGAGAAGGREKNPCEMLRNTWDTRVGRGLGGEGPQPTPSDQSRAVLLKHVTSLLEAGGALGTSHHAQDARVKLLRVVFLDTVKGFIIIK